MDSQDEKSAGFIELQLVDSHNNQIISLGGAGFPTKEAVDAAWADIPAFAGETAFVADRLDAESDITDDKPVSAETCEALLGKPIAQLISEGRANHKKSLEEISNRGGAQQCSTT